MTTKAESTNRGLHSVRLDAAARIVGGATPRTGEAAYWGGPIAWATPKDLSRLKGAFLDSTERTITQAGLNSCAAEVLPAGSVLLSSRAPIGLTAINRIPVATNQGFKSLVPDPNVIDAGYLYHWLRANRTHLESVGNGATFKEVSKAVVSGVSIDLPFKNGSPDLDEQKRIAAILDKADAILSRRREALKLNDDFLRSLFLEMFGDPVTNPKEFPIGTIRDLVESTTYGTSEKAHPDRGAYPVLRMNNITYAGGWDFGSLKYVDLPVSSLDRYLVHNGELLFNRTNSKELVGKTAVYRKDEPMAYAGYLVRAIAKPDADAEYISAYLNSNHGKAVLRGMCKSIVGMANINAQEFLSIPIQLPPTHLQRSFGDIVRLLDSKKERQHEATQCSELLFQSFQQRAFSGQL